MTNVAIIGAGLIGRAWAIVFARAGFDVTLWDQFPLQTTAALAFIADRLPELRAGRAARGRAGNGHGPHPADAIAVGSGARRGLHPGERAGANRRQDRHVHRTGARRAAGCDHCVVVLRHPGQRVHRASEDAAPLPDRASGEPALSGAAGGDLSGPVDRPGGDRAHARHHGGGRPGAGDGEEGGRRVRAEPPARRAAGRGVPAAGGRRHFARPISMRW